MKIQVQASTLVLSASCALAMVSLQPLDLSGPAQPVNERSLRHLEQFMGRRIAINLFSAKVRKILFWPQCGACSKAILPTEFGRYQSAHQLAVLTSASIGSAQRTSLGLPTDTEITFDPEFKYAGQDLYDFAPFMVEVSTAGTVIKVYEIDMLEAEQ